jgi:hypothetical protein
MTPEERARQQIDTSFTSLAGLFRTLADQPRCWRWRFRQKPVTHWLICVADAASGPIQHAFFAVVLPNEMIVQPKVSEKTGWRIALDRWQIDCGLFLVMSWL